MRHPFFFSSDLDVSHFLVDVDVATETFFFRQVSRKSLAATAFLDGRGAFWTGEGMSRRADQITPPADGPPLRLILHIGFCGSTLLASVLDQPRRALILREPHVLAALAEQGSSAPLLWKACNLLFRQFTPGEAVVVKPTNWFNNLAPLLATAPREVLPVIVTSTEREFLTAAFRGGRERIAFLTRLAAHLAQAAPGGSALWQSAAAPYLQPLERAARIVLLARHLQLRFFAAAMRQAGWTDDRCISLRDLTDDLPGSAWKASRLLGLDLDRDELTRRCHLAATKNVKAADSSYSKDQRLIEDEEVWSLNQTAFEAACRWAADTLADQVALERVKGIEPSS